MIHTKYLEIVPEIFKFKLVFDWDEKENRKLRWRKIVNIPYYSTKLNQCVSANLPHMAKSIYYSFQHSTFPQKIKTFQIVSFLKKIRSVTERELSASKSLFAHIKCYWETYSQISKWQYGSQTILLRHRF